MRGLGVLGNSGAVLLEAEIYTPTMTRSHTKEGSLSFDATHFYQYMNDHFSHLDLRLDAIDEREQ